MYINIVFYNSFKFNVMLMKTTFDQKYSENSNIIIYFF